MSSAQEDDEDEQEGNLDESPDLIDSPEVATLRIQALRGDAKRKEEYLRRLKRKLQRLDADVAVKRDEVESLQQLLHLEKSKKDEQVQSEQKERTGKAKVQEERIRDQLSEVLYKKPKTSGSKKQSELDTVLVSFIKPGESIKYNLTFRVDDNTTVSQLRNVVCKYWGVQWDDFILKTMANSKCQRELKVKDCFKQGELAQLRLEQKHRDNTNPPSEAELKAIHRKVKKRSRGAGKGARFNSDAADRIQKFSDNFSQNLKKMGGIYFLLKIRDSKLTEHVNKIKLRDFFIYILLATLTFATYVARRPAGEAYWAAMGIRSSFLREVPYPGAAVPADAYSTTIPSFTDVMNRQEVWWWLNSSLPAIIWDSNNMSANDFNFFIGYVSIRVQSVKNPCTICIEADCSDCQGWRECDKNVQGLVKQLPGARCYPQEINSETQETRDLEKIRRYWEYVTSINQTEDKIRGPTPPWKFMSADENDKKGDISWLKGSQADYDGSGYRVDYRMKLAEPSIGVSMYLADIAEFQRTDQWITNRTKVVIVSFSTYNFDYDVWTASDFLFEFVPGGAVTTRYSVVPFRPTFGESRPELYEMYVDCVRLFIGIYILTVIGAAERYHKTKNHKAGFKYHTSLNGITDWGIAACLFCTCIWRFARFRPTDTAAYMAGIDDTTKSNGFQSISGNAFDYENIMIVEGVLFTFVMYRLLSLFRLVREVYLMWRMLGEALKSLILFVCMFVPALIGFIFISQKMWGPYLYDYTTSGRSTVELFDLIGGRIDIDKILGLGDSIWSAVFVFVFWILVNFLLLNAFATILVDAYYIILLTGSSPGEKWDLQRWYKWVVPSICGNILSGLTSQGASEGS